MLYENGFDELGNTKYLVTDEVDPDFYQLAVGIEPDGYYELDRSEYNREISEQLKDIENDLPF